MKKLPYLIIILLFGLLITGCNGKRSVNEDHSISSDTITVPDTGYTGIKQLMSQKRLVQEVTFKNGVRDGLTKSFYIDGRLRQTFWYKNGLREDSAKWYYPEGQLFRSSPYKNDTLDGTQIQYYRNGKIKARLGYKKGFRTPELTEYTPEGKIVSGYPGIEVKINDEYKTNGSYRITLQLTDKSEKVKFYRGDFSNGVFDTIQCRKINTIKGTGILNLKKTGSPTSGSIGIIAQILTGFGNNHLAFKKIDLPYNDLN